MPRLSLPEPKVMTRSLDEILRHRRTVRMCRPDDLPLEDLAALLFAASGITSADGRRTVPSTLDLRAVDAYVCNRAGAWHYDATNHALEQTTDQDVRRETTLYQFEFVEMAPVTIVFVVDKEKAAKARSTAPYVDAGVMAQTTALAAEALGLTGCIRASFDHETLRQAMKLPEHLEPLVLFTTGKPLP